jgi:hypothetical protein
MRYGYDLRYNLLNAISPKKADVKLLTHIYMTSYSHGLVEALQQQKGGRRIKAPVWAQNLHSW